LRCGEDGTDCAVRHVVPLLDGRCTKSRTVAGQPVPYQWACTCPVCHGPGKLTLTAKGRMLLRFCQRCEAEQDDLTAALTKLLPVCFTVAPSRRSGPVIAADKLIALALAPMPPRSRQLAMLELAGIGTQDALDRLGVARQNRYRVIAGRGSFVVAGATPE
jgi:hypothetical protein